MNTTGLLTGHNMLTDSIGHTWLTDFAEAGPAPLLWNVVAVEALIRYDWPDNQDMQALYDMELSLINGSFSHFDIRDVDTTVRKPLRAIQKLREIAAPLVGPNPDHFHLGMWFQATSRIMTFDPARSYTGNELVRLAHALLAAAMISQRLQHQEPLVEPDSIRPSLVLRLDSEHRNIWVDGIEIKLSDQSYDLLEYLYTHANQVCTRQELVEQALAETYDESNTSQVRRLNTAMRRLREKIEADPNRPRYVHTEHGRGYRLELHSKS